jgi:gliding motility-associated-like protein
MKRTTYFFLLMLFSLQLQAQVFPPDPQCLSGDTLFWDLPVNNCGPFESYDIYFSSSVSGPFSLLDNVTDPVQDFYVHLNPGNETFYYYMTSTYDCPGELVLLSDTVSNVLPQVAPLLSVSVSGNDVELEWTPSASPEVYAYVIYRLIGGNVDPVDTVFTGTSYTDTGAEPNIRSEQYYVIALDPCGNTSIFLNPHSTIYLSISQDACERSMFLEWNPYENFQQGLGSQEIWLSLEGAAPELVTVLGPDATSYNYSVLDDQAEHCFFIRAVEAVSGRGANSNVACEVSDIVTPPDELVLFNATYLESGGVEVNWLWNADAELSATNIEILEGSSTVPGIIPWNDLIVPLEISNSIEVPGSAVPTSYTVSAVDDCGVPWKSKTLSIPFLDGEAVDPGENELAWTPFELEGATVEAYELYRISALGNEFVGTVPGGQLFYLDLIPKAQVTEDPICYYVEARFSQVLPDGSLAVANSRSNTICLVPEAKMYLPNVFAPLGVNNIFRPFILYADASSDYRLQIFNRWGEKVFETRNLEEGWDGYFRGQLQPSGVYIYVLEFEAPGFERIVRKGDVTLVR